MSEHDAARIRKSKFGSIRPRQSIVTKPKFIIGFDSEADTTLGKPMLFQFSLPDTTEENTILIEVPNKLYAGLKAFIEFLENYCTNSSQEYLIYGWNLQYEFTQLLADLPEYVKEFSQFWIKRFKDKDKLYLWTAEIFNAKRQIIVFRKGKIKATFLDGTAFYATSLDKAARMLNLGEKYTLTALSRTNFTREDLNDPEFIYYAKRDAYITRLIGEYIQHQHKIYQVPTSISAPHFASNVFKTTFLKSPIAPPPLELEQAGIYSYHGGKNGYYLDRPTEFPSIWQYDITSAYPEAMRQLPNIEIAEWSRTSKYIPNEHGLYYVSGLYNPCTYLPLQIHDGSRPLASKIERIWVTSYELDSLIEKEEFHISSIFGYLYRGASGGPLSEYVDRFFQIKRHTTGPERETAKLFLNSLYGKFYQKQELGTVGYIDLDNARWITSDPRQDYDYEAGGLYHPPIASLITGYVRAKIHRLEHKYESVMTSTDGLFGNISPDKADIGKDLGKLTESHGRLRIWRERLYCFDADNGERKIALHGFHGKINDLEEIPLKKGIYKYYGTQVITLKMSTKEIRGEQYTAGRFVRMPFMLIL